MAALPVEEKKAPPGGISRESFSERLHAISSTSIGGGWTGEQVLCTLTLPADCVMRLGDAEFKSASGGKVVVKVRAGPITFSVKVDGNTATVNTINGDVRIYGEVAGNINTEEGNVTVWGDVKGNVTAKEGDITAREIGGKATATEGDIITRHR